MKNGKECKLYIEVGDRPDGSFALIHFTGMDIDPTVIKIVNESLLLDEVVLICRKMNAIIENGIRIRAVKMVGISKRVDNNNDFMCTTAIALNTIGLAVEETDAYTS